jgi:hypothetical protein
VIDWQTFADGMKRWFALRSGIPEDFVVWRGEAEGMMARPCAYLSVLVNARAPGTDEVRLVPQGSGKDALVNVVGNRVFTLSCKVITRDQTPTGRAYTVLELVDAALYLPSSQETFHNLGVGLIGTVALVDMDRVFDMRQESQAVLDIKLSAALDTSTEPRLAETQGTIEHVQVGGTAKTDDEEAISIPERVIP